MQTRTLKRLGDLRLNLLRLHKVLLDDEREAYERFFGPVNGSGQMLSLVMSHPFFDWLHKISQLIIQIDELSEDPEGKEESADAHIATALSLILPSEKETEFHRRYKEVLRRNPAAVIAHANVLKAIHDD